MTRRLDTTRAGTQKNDDDDDDDDGARSSARARVSDMCFFLFVRSMGSRQSSSTTTVGGCGDDV